MGADRGGDAVNRDWTRTVLVICGVLAAILVGLLIASLGSGGLAGSPIESALPGEEAAEIEFNGDDSLGGGGSGGLGALNPGERTGVGGEIGLDNETFGSEDTTVHFTVESSQPAYWRTGAFDTYTGSGWERTDERESVEEELTPDGMTGEQASYEVTLERPATALPTVWQPSEIHGVEDIAVTDEGAIVSDEQLQAGTTFSGISHKPPDDIDLLRSAGESYPPEITARYTQLPADTPDRVASFTDELTEDTENSYEAARVIEQWLRTEKNYSLEASEQSDHIADTFIFEMDAGYCEYFATAMTTMLRTQDIPARYTVGYTTGTLVGENTYEVRGMNAHAWVEVYFEGVGWVKFEPTPGDDRLDAEQQALEEDGLDDETDFDEEPGSPEETFEPGEVNPPEDELPAEEDDIPDEDPPDEDSDEADDGQDDEDSSDEDDHDEDQNGEETDNGETDETQDEDDTEENGDETDENDVQYEIELDRTPVPGADVTVTVTADGNPASDVTVTFNGEAVGTTDSGGTVTGTVPYESELEIGLEPSTEESLDSFRLGGVVSLGSSAVTGGSLFAPRQVVGQDAEYDEQRPVLGYSDVYPVETNATLVLTGDPLPGETVTITALVEDVPVPDADVTLDGEHVTTTDESGQASVTLPADAGSVELAVEREAVSGVKTVDIPQLDVDVETALPVAVPLGSATVTASYENTTASNATVALDGTTVTTTGPDGAASISLPLATATDVSVVHDGSSAEVTVENILRNFVLLVGFGLAVLGGALAVLFRRGYRLADLRRALVQFPQKIVTLVTGTLIAVASAGESIAEAIHSRLKTTAEYLWELWQGTASPGELWTMLCLWIQAKRERIANSTRRVLERVSRDGPTTAASRESREPDPRERVRNAWRQFLRHVSVRQVNKHTPGELASHAIERDDLPADAVVTLRDTYRAVEYGARPPETQLERIQHALETIEVDDSEDVSAGGAD